VSIIGFSKFFLESCKEISGWTDAHTDALIRWFNSAITGIIQIRDSDFQYRSVFFNGHAACPGYRHGVVLNTIPQEVFEGLPTLKSRVVKVNEDTEFVTVCKSRIPGEKPRKKTMALVEELPEAKYITAVLYHKDVLAEDNDRSTDAEWELVTVLCQMDVDEPMAPSTLMANHFKADGGTDTQMGPKRFEEALRKSYNYWKSRSLGVTHEEYSSMGGRCSACVMTLLRQNQNAVQELCEFLEAAKNDTLFYYKE
jgi:hypothetical protein